MATVANPSSPQAGGNASAATPAAPAVSRLAPALEIALAYALLEGALWTENHARWAWSLAAAWIVGITLYRRPSLRQLGLGRSGLKALLWIVPVAAAIGALSLAGAYFAGTLHPYVLRRTFLEAALGYLFWAWQQEFILQSFIFLRLETLVGSARKAVPLAALLFSAAHIPNPLLMLATLAAGAIFCELFRRYRNIYPLAVAHAALGIVLAAAVPEAVHHHMRVGIGYLTYPH